MHPNKQIFFMYNDHLLEFIQINNRDNKMHYQIDRINVPNYNDVFLL